ncbi:hypothetical protein E2P81_ATG10878 [Venturia nashicola]|nr:hypothetical protein E2P81_ATG10878 [Venturia nashicola]
MSINTQGLIIEEEEAESAHDTEVGSRKRAASSALDIQMDKRPRHEQVKLNERSGSNESLERSGAESLCEQERYRRSTMLTEDDVLYRRLEKEIADMAQYKASKYDPTHVSDPGYDQFYGYTRTRRPSTTVVEESKSYIICDSPQEALVYFKTHERDVRRRIKHIIFSSKAVAVGPSLNGMHWKGLCNYVRKYMCIESIMIPVPYDPLSGHIRYKSSEIDDMMEDAMESRSYLQSLPANDGASYPPPQLSTGESFVLRSRRRTFDWKILFYLSQALVSGFLKEIRLNYPASFGYSMSPNFKAMKAIHEHTQDYAREKRKIALQAGNVDPDCVRSQYAFNLSMRVSTPGESTSAVAISKMHHSRQSHPRLSLLGLPRETRDRILELAISSGCSTSLQIMNYALDAKTKRIQIRPLSSAYCALRLVSRQIQLEASPFLFKKKTLVIACDAKEAYRFLIRIPTDELKHIKTIRLHELVLYSGDEGNRHAWPRLAEFIASQIPLQELVLHVPNDPILYETSTDEDKSNTSEDEEEEGNAEEVERYRNMIKDWIGYWWPGARLAMQLLLQKRIAKCIKLRHEAEDYLDRCGFPSQLELHELQAVCELRYAYDNRLDESFRYMMAKRMFELFMLSTQFTGDEEWYEVWYEEDMMQHPCRKTFEFDTSAGVDDDGYQVVVITRKTELEDVVLVQGQKRPGEHVFR